MKEKLIVSIYLPFQSPDACNSGSWTGAKLGAGNLIHISHVGSKHSTSRASQPLYKGMLESAPRTRNWTQVLWCRMQMFLLPGKSYASIYPSKKARHCRRERVRVESRHKWIYSGMCKGFHRSCLIASKISGIEFYSHLSKERSKKLRTL